MEQDVSTDDIDPKTGLMIELLMVLVAFSRERGLPLARAQQAFATALTLAEVAGD